jgi:hypothetical protein
MLPSSALIPIVELPRLKILSLVVNDRDREPAALPFKSEHLTHLKLQGGVTASVRHSVPSRTPRNVAALL